MDIQLIDKILQELTIPSKSFRTEPKSIEFKKIASMTFKLKKLFKLLSWQLNCVVNLKSSEKISFKILFSSISMKSKSYKTLFKLYCEIFIDLSSACFFSEIESKIINERLIYIDKTKKELQYFSKFDTKCEISHIIFLNGFKTKSKRKKNTKYICSFTLFRERKSSNMNLKNITINWKNEPRFDEYENIESQ